MDSLPDGGERPLLLEQYKLYVEMMDRTSARRTDTNKFFVTLMTALLALIAVVVEKKLWGDVYNGVLFVTAVVGLGLCWVWYSSICSFSQLNSAKSEVIHRMEQLLPFRCYEVEWSVLGEGKDPELYRPISQVEERVPLVLAIPYFLLLAYSLWPVVSCLLERRP